MQCLIRLYIKLYAARFVHIQFPLDFLRANEEKLKYRIIIERSFAPFLPYVRRLSPVVHCCFHFSFFFSLSTSICLVFVDDWFYENLFVYICLFIKWSAILNFWLFLKMQLDPKSKDCYSGCDNSVRAIWRNTKTKPIL